MIRILLMLIFCFSLSSVSTHAQSLSIMDQSTHMNISNSIITIQSADNGGWVGYESLDLYIKVNNNSASILEIGAKKIELDTLQADVEHTICFAGACYAASVFISPNHLFLPSGTSDSGFVAHYLFDNRVHVRGVNHVMYVFYNVNDRNDSVAVNVTYNTIVSTGINEQNSQSESIKIYPNPANDRILIELENTSVKTSDLQFEITNALGAKEAKLQPEKNGRILSYPTSDLANGIYFYSLSENNSVLMKGKFMVLH